MPIPMAMLAVTIFSRFNGMSNHPIMAKFSNSAKKSGMVLKNPRIGDLNINDVSSQTRKSDVRML